MKKMTDNLKNIVGKHLIYTYDNGWQYEIYIKNSKTIDYRIHSGIVANRWVKGQQVHLVSLSSSMNIYKISWTEPTGTSVSLAINLDERHIHGVIFFPRWVINQPEKTVCFQNDHLDEMHQYRDLGPTYPIEVIDEFANITFIETCQLDDETIIDCAAKQLPYGYANRNN
jgi:phenolic acid decarboxylase